jgi:hypothetical protein
MAARCTAFKTLLRDLATCTLNEMTTTLNDAYSFPSRCVNQFPRTYDGLHPLSPSAPLGGAISLAGLAFINAPWPDNYRVGQHSMA